MSDDRFDPDSTVYSNAKGTMLRSSTSEEWLTNTEWFLKEMRKQKWTDEEIQSLTVAKRFYRKSYEEAKELFKLEKETLNAISGKT